MNLRWLFSTDQRTLHVNEKCLTSHLRLWIDDFWQKKKHQKMWHDVLQLKKTDCSHRRCSIKKVFLKISQNTQENICARVYFLIKLNASACNFIMKESLVQVFSSEFFKIHLFYRTPLGLLLQKTLEHFKIQESLRPENRTQYYLYEETFLCFFLPWKIYYKHKMK